MVVEWRGGMEYSGSSCAVGAGKNHRPKVSAPACASAVIHRAGNHTCGSQGRKTLGHELSRTENKRVSMESSAFA